MLIKIFLIAETPPPPYCLFAMDRLKPAANEYGCVDFRRFQGSLTTDGEGKLMFRYVLGRTKNVYILITFGFLNYRSVIIKRMVSIGLLGAVPTRRTAISS